MKEFYYGIDLHSKRFTLHYLKQEGGKITERKTKTMAIKDMDTDLILNLTKNDYVCIEASCGAFAFAEKIKPFIKNASVINPYDFKSVYMSGKKTDKIDARKLAENLYNHVQNKKNGFKDNFPEVHKPTDSAIELRGLFSTYEVLIKQKVCLKNRIHSILRQNLIDYTTSNLFNEIEMILNSDSLKEVYKKQIKLLLRQIDSVKIESDEVINMIKEIGYEYYKPEVSILISMAGISVFSACAIMADIDTIDRFKTAKKLCSYLRSAMRVDSSDKKTYIGKINKKARKLSFKMLLQGLQHMVRTNPSFTSFKEKKLKGKSKGKVRCALVRKTIVAIFYMLKNKALWKYCNTEKYQNKLKTMEKEIKLIKDNNIAQAA